MPVPTSPIGTAHVTGALIRMLTTVCGFKVGDGDGPVVTDSDQLWFVVEAIPGGYTDGDIATPDAEKWVVYQVTTVGRNRLQAEAGRDRADQAILRRSTAGGFTNAIDAYTLRDGNDTLKSLAADLGIAVADRVHDSSGGTFPEGVVFNTVERYQLWVVPA